MAIVAERITSTGTYYTYGSIDEVTTTTYSVSTVTVYCSGIDEISINPLTNGLAKRVTSTGVIMVANGFDETTQPT